MESLIVDKYFGITLIKAEDKTPKNERVGNYYHKVGKGYKLKFVSIEKFNRIHKNYL